MNTEETNADTQPFMSLPVSASVWLAMKFSKLAINRIRTL